MKVNVQTHKYSMRIKELLREGGIQTATVDRAARAALAKTLPSVIQSIIKQVKTRVKTVVNPEDYEYNSDYYDKLYQYLSKNPGLLLQPICSAVSDVFTEVSKDRLKQIFKNSSRIDLLTVIVEVRSTSTDSYKDYGGYYSEYNNLLKIFVNDDDILDAAHELIQDEILGDSERRGYVHMINLLVKVFVHEYAHLEQNFRNKKPGTRDFGYITAGEKRGRKGKRGGLMRTPRESLTAYLRYKGNLDEIDSFASEAASEAMSDILSTKHMYNINSTITIIQQDMAAGYASSRSYSHYGEMLRDAFDGAYANIGLDPKQMEKVWKRFAKRVYQKLEDYRITSGGKEKVQQDNINQKWLDAANRMSMKDTIDFMARDAAASLEKYPDDEYRTEKVKKHIMTGWYTFDQEEFIRNYYYGFEREDFAKGATDIFRRRVLRYYEQSLD